MRAFLGRVPLKASRSRSLGQVEFTDPWGATHRVTIEPPPPPPLHEVFNPPFSKKQEAIDQREQEYLGKIGAKRQECDFLKMNMEDHKSYYYDREESGDEEYQNYGHALDQYNDCLDKIDALIDEMNTVPVDFGETPEDTGYKWPAEVPEPTGRPFVHEEPYIHHPEDYPPVQTGGYEWPVEVPKPEDYPPEEPPELVEPPPPTPPVTPPTTTSVDWRTSGCPAGTARMVRGGMCVSSSLVSTATGAVTSAPTFTMGRIPLSPGLGVRALGRHF